MTKKLKESKTICLKDYQNRHCWSSIGVFAREGIIQGLIRQQHKSISKQRVREARGRLYRNLNQKGCLDDFFRELGLEDEKGGGVK